jgi:hypothetical protein
MVKLEEGVGNAYEHGMSNTRFYHIWAQIRQRCVNKNCVSYSKYGKRGIKVCDNWLVFINFRDDMYPSYLEHCEIYGEKQTTIDRIEGDGNYCKENCRWATYKEQANNESKNVIITYGDESLNITQWAEKLNIDKNCLYQRIRKGWSVKRTIEEPVKQNR